VRDGRVVRRAGAASGLVTALGRSCRRAAASGSPTAAARRREVGERIGLPSSDPTYTLRRVAERRRGGGYYYGSPRGALALCTSCTSVRASRRDWEHYRTVNERFARTLLSEMETVEEPIVLVQDYTRALPRW